jgi:hypothetical protein
MCTSVHAPADTCAESSRRQWWASRGGPASTCVTRRVTPRWRASRRRSRSDAAAEAPAPAAAGGSSHGRAEPHLPRGATARPASPDADEAEEVPSWEEIAEQYGAVVYTMAYRLTGDRDEARDLAQDVFVRVYRNLDRYRPGTFEGWLYRITKNLFLDRCAAATACAWSRCPRRSGASPAT